MTKGEKKIVILKIKDSIAWMYILYKQMVKSKNHTIPNLSSKCTEFSACVWGDEFSSYVLSIKPFSTSLVKPPWISVIIPLN